MATPESKPQYPWDFTLLAIKNFISRQGHLFEPAPLSSFPNGPPLLDKQPHPPGTFRGTAVFPLWHTYDGFDAHSPHWTDTQILFDALIPMLGTLNNALLGHDKEAWENAYHTCQARRDSKAGIWRHQRFRDNHCFESIRISINLAIEPTWLRNALHETSVVVVQTFGRFRGGEIMVGDGGDYGNSTENKVYCREPLRPGEWFCVGAGKEFGSLPFKGERIQVELFTPERGAAYKSPYRKSHNVPSGEIAPAAGLGISMPRSPGLDWMRPQQKREASENLSVSDDRTISAPGTPFNQAAAPVDSSPPADSNVSALGTPLIFLTPSEGNLSTSDTPPNHSLNDDGDVSALAAPPAPLADSIVPSPSVPDQSTHVLQQPGMPNLSVQNPCSPANQASPEHSQNLSDDDAWETATSQLSDEEVAENEMGHGTEAGL